MVHVEQNRIVAGDGEQTKPDDEHSGHRAAAESNLQRRSQTAARGLRRSHVGANRDDHADEAGRT